VIGHSRGTMSDFTATGRLALQWLGLRGSKQPASADPANIARPRGRLFRKYFLLIVGLVSLMLLLNGGVDLWFTYTMKTVRRYSPSSRRRRRRRHGGSTNSSPKSSAN
jgi:hypothetical protein